MTFLIHFENSMETRILFIYNSTALEIVYRDTTMVRFVMRE